MGAFTLSRLFRIPRQFHGFYYENRIINRYNLIKTPTYTHPYDAQTTNGMPVQIKCVKLGSSINLGSYFNNKNRQEDFILHIGFWKTNRRNVIKEKTLHITNRSWSSLFTLSQDDNVFTQFRSFSNSREDDQKFKEFLKSTKIFGIKKPIRIRFKRDHKRQRRVQCAIPYQEFENYFLTNFKETSL